MRYIALLLLPPPNSPIYIAPLCQEFSVLPSAVAALWLVACLWVCDACERVMPVSV